MYRVIWCFWRRDGKRHPHTAVRKQCTITQCCINVGPVLKLHCLRKVYSRPSDGLVLGQLRRRLTGIEPAMGCDAGPTLNRNLVGRPTSSVHRRQVLNECRPAPAMVVEEIHVEDVF